MGIRIPTGLKETTATVSKSDLLLFQCTKCKRPSLTQYPLQTSSSATYHVFQSQESKGRTIDSANRAASQRIYQQSAYLAQAINETRNYDAVDRCVTCPYCGHRQEWSTLPPKSTPRWLPILLVLAIVLLPLWFFIIIFSIMTVLDHPVLFIPIGSLACLVGAFWIRAIQRKRKQKETHRQEMAWFSEEVRSGRIEAPIYYNELNLNDLLEGPHRELVQNLHTDKDTAKAEPKEKGTPEERKREELYFLDVGSQLLQSEYSKKSPEKINAFLYNTITNMKMADLGCWNDQLLFMAYAYLTSQAPVYFQAQNNIVKEAIYQVLHSRISVSDRI